MAYKLERETCTIYIQKGKGTQLHTFALIHTYFLYFVELVSASQIEAFNRTLFCGDESIFVAGPSSLFRDFLREVLLLGCGVSEKMYSCSIVLTFEKLKLKFDIPILRGTSCNSLLDGNSNSNSFRSTPSSSLFNTPSLHHGVQIFLGFIFLFGWGAKINQRTMSSCVI